MSWNSSSDYMCKEQYLNEEFASEEEELKN